MTRSEWNPDAYARFADLRLQPALDLLMHVRPLPAGDIVDLGCGNGAVGPVLRTRFAERTLIGIDTSAVMLAKARDSGAYERLEPRDMAEWAPDTPPALIFSNAALHWLDDHHRLLPRLAGLLAPGGTLAVQMPHQNRAPSHRLWLDLVQQHFPNRHDPDNSPGILSAPDYYHLLSPLGQLSLWETEYYQTLPPAPDMHPVRAFTSASFARPVLDALNASERAVLCALYDAAMDSAYPRASDGSVLFPFRRLFFTLDI